MATDVERLAVLIEANTKSYENAMKKLQQQTDRTLNGMEKRFKTAGKKLESSFSGVGDAFNRSLGLLGLGVGLTQSIRAIGQAASEYVNLKNQLKVAGLEGDNLEGVLGSLFAIAQKNGTAIAPLATLYSRAAQAQAELKASSGDLLKFTEGVSVALRVAGTDSTQAAGALLQLSQALGSGVVRAEEFNSVNEGARPILQAVAAGLKEAGGSVSALKTLVNDGKVSSEAFFRAFLAGMPAVESMADKAQATVGQATERISNAFILLVGQLDKTTGASNNAAENLSRVASVLERMPAWIDSASGSLDGLIKKLNEAGNSEFWQKFNDYMRARGLMESGDVTDLRFKAKQGDPAAKAELKRRDIVDQIATLEANLADARNTADQTGLSVDRERVGLLEQRLAIVREEARILGAGAIAPSSAQAPAGRIAEFGRSKEGRSLARGAVTPVSLANFAVPGKAKGGNSVGVDSFERATAAAQKRITVMEAENKTIGQLSEKRERAKLVAELETAAIAANTAAGMKNAEVTATQRDTIEAMATRMEAAARNSRELEAQLKGVNDVAEFAGSTLQTAFENILDGADAGTTALRALRSELLKAAFTGQGAFAQILGLANPVGGQPGGIAGLFSSLLGGIGGGAGGAGAGVVLGRFGRNAAGTNNWRGGPTWVGEKGAEIVDLPKGARVTPNHKIGGSTVVNMPISISAPGADPAQLARVEAAVRDLNKGLDKRVASAVHTQNRRGYVS